MLNVCFNMQDSFHSLLHKADGKRSEWEYPFAVAGVNISYMLVQMLDLQSGEICSNTLSLGQFTSFALDFELSFFFSSMQSYSLSLSLLLQEKWAQKSVLNLFNYLEKTRWLLITFSVWPFRCLTLSGSQDKLVIWNSMCVLCRTSGLFYWLLILPPYSVVFISIFQEVLKSMRIQLEQELTIGSISCVQEMPSFRLLKRQPCLLFTERSVSYLSVGSCAYYRFFHWLYNMTHCKIIYHRIINPVYIWYFGKCSMFSGVTI